MVNYEAGRECSICKEVLRVDEFRYKNKRKDKRHLICFDCEPSGGFSTALLQDALIPPEKKIKRKSPLQKEIRATGESISTTYTFDGEVGLVRDHFLMLASSCEDIAKQIVNMCGGSKTNSEVCISAGLAAKKVAEAIKILS